MKFKILATLLGLLLIGVVYLIVSANSGQQHHQQQDDGLRIN